MDSPEVAESLELPVGSEVQFVQKNASAIPDVAQIGKTAVDRPNVSHLLFLVQLLLLLPLFVVL
jgi:hypothetical protein